MATYNASDLASKPLSSIDQAAVYFGTVSPGTNTATSDKMRPCRIPAGFRVTAVMVNVRTAFASTAPAKIGFSHVDGTTPDATVFPNPDTQIAAITDTSHASTGTKLVMPQAGVFTTVKESYLEIVFGTVATPATGVADYVIFGEFAGSK